MKFILVAFFLTVVLQYFSFADVPDDNLKVTETIQNGITSFTVKLNRLLQENNTKNANVLFSPISIYAALALIHLGTDGSTRKEVADVMGIPETLGTYQIHNSIKSLLISAQEGRETRMYANGEVKKVNATSINFADGIFLQNGLSLNENYTADTKSYYNSEVVKVDFVNKREEATDIINKYVANKTENNIPQLYSEPVSSDTRILMASSLYFKSSWDKKFMPEITRSDVFYSEKGDITVDMMRNVIDIPYADIPSLGVEAVKLWFAEKLISTIIIKPHKNKSLSNFLKNLSTDDINKIIEELNVTDEDDYTYVSLKLPKTAFKWSKKLNEELIQLGMKKLFTEEADLKNMVNETNLKVTEVSHATDIKITENGIEASAVTITQIGLRTAYHKKKAVFYADKPFLVLIYHEKIKSILFFGSVHNPNL